MAGIRDSGSEGRERQHRSPTPGSRTPNPSFSSPFLTAIFTVMVFLIGRSADTLGNLPERVFGSSLRSIGMVLARIFPNLFLYVPSRPVLLGQVPGVPLTVYVAQAWGNALLYSAVLLVASAIVFRRRDFQ